MISNASEVSIEIGKKMAELRNMNPPLKKSSILMRKSVKDNFSQGGRPIRWRPKSKATIAIEKSILGRTTSKPLIFTGNLRKSISYRKVNDKIYEVFPAGIGYAGIHQYGGRTNFAGRNIPVPARPFMVFQNSDLDSIVNIFKEHIEKKLGI